MQANILQLFQTNWTAYDLMCPSNQNITIELLEEVWRKKTEDANLQITAEMLGTKTQAKQAGLFLFSLIPPSLPPSLFKLAGTTSHCSSRAEGWWLPGNL